MCHESGSCVSANNFSLSLALLWLRAHTGMAPMEESVSQSILGQFCIGFQVGYKHYGKAFSVAWGIYSYLYSLSAIYQQYKVSQTVVCGQYVLDSLVKRWHAKKKILQNTEERQNVSFLSCGINLIYGRFQFIFWNHSMCSKLFLLAWLVL